MWRKTVFEKQLAFILVCMFLLIWPITGIFPVSAAQSSVHSNRSVTFHSTESIPKTRWLYLANNKIDVAITLGDINKDGQTEIIFGSDSGYFYVLNKDGKTVWYIKAYRSVKTTPGLLDVNNDGFLDIIFGTSNGDVYAVNGSDGKIIWEKHIGGVIRGSCSIADVNKDGKSEIIVTVSSLSESVYGGAVDALSSDNGDTVWSMPLVGGPAGSAAIGDIDNDGFPEVVVGDRNYSLFVFSGKDGSRELHLRDIIPYGISPILGDIDGDGNMDIVIVNNLNALTVIDGVTKEIKWTVKPSEGLEPISPTLGDLDDNGIPEIIAGGRDKKIYVFSGLDGSEKWSYEVGEVIAGPAALGDIDGDNKLDIVMCTGESVYGINGEDGSLLWYYLINSYLQVPPVIYDIDNDGNLEILYGFSNALGALGFTSEGSTGARVFWPTFGGTSNNTRNIKDVDPDEDGLSTFSEKFFGANPYADDTDNDGIPDGWEVTFGLNPKDSTDASSDLDGDGLSNLDEYRAHTNPTASDTDHDIIPDAIDLSPTNWWLPMFPIYVGTPLVGASWATITARKRRKKKIAEAADKCLKVFNERGAVDCKEVARDLNKKALSSVVRTITSVNPDVIIIEETVVIRKTNFDAVMARIEELTASRLWEKHDLIKKIEEDFGYSESIAKKLVEYICREKCFELGKSKFCSKELAFNLINEIEKIGIITPGKVVEKFNFLTLNDAKMLISEGQRRGLILPSKTSLDIWYGKTFIEEIMSKIKDRVLASSKNIIPINELIPRASEIPPSDLKYYFYAYLVREADVIPRLDGTTVYTQNYLLQEINKRFDVYAEIRISELARELNVDFGVLRNTIIKLIESGKLHARVRGDVLVSLLTLLAESEPQLPPQAPIGPTHPPVETITSPEPSLPTITIPGYRILKVLGSGGFATVFKAVDRMNREVALKIIPTTDITTKKTFAREILVWKPLNHPNIVKLYDFGIDPIPFMALELMDGSLRHKMTTQKITLEETLKIIKQIALALEYAHGEFNLIHRDIKPENILFKDDTYKLSDWTLSIIQGLIRKEMEFSGTIIYSAPEQFDKAFGEIGPWTDIWQLGVVFYELLSGEPPFGKNPTEAIDKILHSPPSLISGVPTEVWNIVYKMLQKDPKLRPSITEIIARINELQR